MKRIKQKKAQLKIKEKNNGNTKEILQQEMRKNALMQNDVTPSMGIDDLDSPIRMYGQANSEQFQSILNINQPSMTSLTKSPHMMSQAFPDDLSPEMLKKMSQSEQMKYQSQISISQTTQNVKKEQNRIHMLYKGKMHEDVEKEKKLMIYQLQKVKFEVKKQSTDMTDLKAMNIELRQKIQRYTKLIAESKIQNKKQLEEDNIPEDIHELSVTRKLGHTEYGGGVSYDFEIGTNFNDRIEEGLSPALINVDRLDKSHDSYDWKRRGFHDEDAESPKSNILSASFHQAPRKFSAIGNDQQVSHDGVQRQFLPMKTGVDERQLHEEEVQYA